MLCAVPCSPHCISWVLCWHLHSQLVCKESTFLFFFFPVAFPMVLLAPQKDCGSVLFMWAEHLTTHDWIIRSHHKYARKRKRKTVASLLSVHCVVPHPPLLCLFLEWCNAGFLFLCACLISVMLRKLYGIVFPCKVHSHANHTYHSMLPRT